MDVNREVLMKEAIRINLAIPGAFTVNDLFDMEWPVYESTVQIIIDILKERNNAG
jgi:hypothetical protein